jgi:hypothetical protein
MSYIIMGNIYPVVWAKKTLVAQSVELALRKAK